MPTFEIECEMASVIASLVGGRSNEGWRSVDEMGFTSSRWRGCVLPMCVGRLDQGEETAIATCNGKVRASLAR